MHTQDYLEYELSIQRGQDGSYRGRFLDLPGSEFEGVDQAEVWEKAKQVFDIWCEKSKSLGISLPEPGSHRSVNGTIRLRIARTLHHRIAELAKANDVSISALVTSMLSAGAHWLLNETGMAVNNACPNVDSSVFNLHIGSHRGWTTKDSGDYSGEWIQKIPLDLHHELVWLAKSEGLSISALTQFLLDRVFWNAPPDNLHIVHEAA